MHVFVFKQISTSSSNTFIPKKDIFSRLLYNFFVGTTLSSFAYILFPTVLFFWQYNRDTERNTSYVFNSVLLSNALQNYLFAHKIRDRSLASSFDFKTLSLSLSLSLLLSLPLSPSLSLPPPSLSPSPFKLTLIQNFF